MTAPTETMLDHWGQITDRASVGPWTVDDTSPDIVYPGIDGPNGPVALYGDESDSSGILLFDDAMFIAIARTVVPVLIEEVRSLRLRLEMTELVRESA